MESRALNKDPHLRSSPLQGEGKKAKAESYAKVSLQEGNPGFFAAAALNDTRKGR